MLPVEKEGNLGTRSAASFGLRLDILTLSTTSRSSSSSKSSMSSTVNSRTSLESVNSWTSVELKDSDFATLAKDTTGDGAKTGFGTEIGAGGGALFGGEPEVSGFVTKKNSSTEPVLFWKWQKNSTFKHNIHSYCISN